jgi:bifunctional DNA-binding transcriptional regulator/antitoxin component of YhaV-PrlF toxin-antitoxin module
MTKVDDSTYILKVRRKIQFTGQNKVVATVTLPATIRQINRLKSGDSVEVIYDMRKPDECRLIFKKAGADDVQQG